MRFMLAALSAALMMPAVVEGQTVWISVADDERGREVMGFAAQEQPYAPGRLERVGGGVTRPARDKRGRVISAFGLYGWKDGANVRVVLLVFVPVDGAANQQYTAGDKLLRPEVYARYTVPVGGTRELGEMKALGLPSFLRVTVRPLRN